MDLMKLTGLAVSAVIFILILKQSRSELAPAVSLCVSAVFAAAAAANLYPVIDYIKTLSTSTGFGGYYALLLKALGVGIIAQTTADICADAGENALAAKVELLGRAELLLLALPLIKDILKLAGEIVYG